MFVKSINDCAEFTANDGCQIKEWLHPKNDPVDLFYSVAMATVAPGQKSYKHKLEQTEVYLILSGKGTMHIDDDIKEVGEGDAIYIDALRTQWIENTADVPLQFIALVNPPWSDEGDTRV